MVLLELYVGFSAPKKKKCHTYSTRQSRKEKVRPSSLFQLAETKAYKTQNIRLKDQNKLDFLNQKRLLKIIQKKHLKYGLRIQEFQLLGAGKYVFFNGSILSLYFHISLVDFSFLLFMSAIFLTQYLRSSFFTLEQSLIYTSKKF